MVLAYAAASGRAVVQSRAEAAAMNTAEVAEARARLLERMQRRLREGEESRVPPWVGSAMDITFSSFLPAGPLADFAIGQSDLLPSNRTLSLWDPDVRLFSKYEFDDPVALASGTFNLSQAVVLVLPLMLIALCFDVLSSDRDGRRLGLLLAMGPHLRRSVWARMTVRVGSVLALTSLVALVALLTGLSRGASLADRVPWFVAWLVGVYAYVVFWTALIVAVAARNRSGQDNAFSLVFAWAAVVLLVPAAVVAVAEAVYPTPSRLALLAEARGAESRAVRDSQQAGGRFLSDHPEISAREALQVPAYIRTAYWVTSEVDRATRPSLVRFERTAAARKNAMLFLEYLSPAIVFHQWAIDLAGASGEPHRAYQRAAREFKAAFGARVGPSLMGGRRLSPTEVEALPVFRMAPQPLREVVLRHVGAMAVMLAVAAILFRGADRRLAAIIGP